MTSVDKLPAVMESNEFFATLFDAIPCGVLVVDSERRILAANQVFETALGLSPGTSVGACEGTAIGCLNASGEGHPHRENHHECRTCDARRLAFDALKENRTRRGRVHFRINVDGRVQDLTLHLNAAPFQTRDGRFAIVIIEDVSKLRLIRQPISAETTHGMVGSDPTMLDLYETVRQVAPLDVPVLIQGESGTGKELVANAIHRESRRCDRLLVPVNCGALPDGLLESELFGHVKGAFTGAVRDKRGRFQLADGGTIFLDEIGELSPKMQVKFLRVLQNGCFERVGDEKTVEVDARVVCATNRDLEADVAAGRFRADLFYRLCVVPITIPPLRQRPGDIANLAAFFLKKASGDSDRQHPGFTEEAMERLIGHEWPGNVRELENAVRFAVIKARGSAIRAEDLPPQVQTSRRPRPRVARRGKLDLDSVRDALEVTGGNKSEAARHLGVSRATLYRFLSERELRI